MTARLDLSAIFAVGARSLPRDFPAVRHKDWPGAVRPLSLSKLVLVYHGQGRAGIGDAGRCLS